MMKISVTKIAIVALIALLLGMGGCTTTQQSKATKSEKTLFSKAMADTLVVGDATRDDVTVVMGPPYMKLPLGMESEQWIYMYTTQDQLIFTFDEGRLIAKEWSSRYGTPVR